MVKSRRGTLITYIPGLKASVLSYHSMLGPGDEDQLPLPSRLPEEFPKGRGGGVSEPTELSGPAQSISPMHEGRAMPESREGVWL